MIVGGDWDLSRYGPLAGRTARDAGSSECGCSFGGVERERGPTVTTDRKETSRPTKRSYPPFWEKAVPFLVVLVVVVIVVLLIIAVAAVLGVFPGSA
jgi:hypothetical protein